MEKPFAITLDVGSSRANKTGSWRTERAVYVDRMPPCNDACPAGENVQLWLYDGRGGRRRLRARVADDHGRQPVPRRDGPGLLPPVRDGLQPRPARRGGRHQLRRAVRRRRGAAAGLAGRRRGAADRASTCSWSAPGPSGLSAAYHLARLGHAVTVKEAGPMAGGMMRFGIPRYRLPREVLDAEVQRILDLGVTLELDAKVTDLMARQGGVRRGVPRRGRPARQAGLPPGRARRRTCSTRSTCCAGSRRASSRCSAAGSPSTAAATPRWTPPAPRSGSAPRRPSWSTAAPGTGCRRTPPRSPRPRTRACSSPG